MATWMAHLRVADHFLHRIKNIDEKEFIVGNIGPDSGVPNEDWSKFTPSTDITHWRNKQINNEIDHEAFYRMHLEEPKPGASFYLGYYIHLVCDDLWGKVVYKPKKTKYIKELESDNNFIWIMKEDWYDLDFDYKQSNPNMEAYRLFCEINEFENKYLEYYPANAFTRQINHIKEFYSQYKDLSKRNYQYLIKNEMDEYIEIAKKEVTEKLRGKNLTIAST